jgi:phage baseplate assembly protein W
MNIRFPYHIDDRGRTAETRGDEHIKDLIEQVLFTSPGERINQPDFGSGLLQLVFAPVDDALAATVQMSIQGALQQWLGDLINIESVDVTSEESTVMVNLCYMVRRTGERRSETFSKGML